MRKKIFLILSGIALLSVAIVFLLKTTRQHRTDPPIQENKELNIEAQVEDLEHFRADGKPLTYKMLYEGIKDCPIPAGYNYVNSNGLMNFHYHEKDGVVGGPVIAIKRGLVT